jgi:glycosyltransferase involved in cell wall biosynthesis
MRILYVNTADTGGGAFRQAADLRNEMLRLGHDVMVACRVKLIEDANVFTFDNNAHRGAWAKLMLRAFGLNPEADTTLPGDVRRRRLAIALGEPLRTWRVYNGHTDFDFPGTQHLLRNLPRKPDLIHLWNLHGGYFDMRVLPELSREIPVVIDLQDNWAFTGHCAYFRDCDRWENGCKPCKYLEAPPAVAKDNAHANWTRKRDLYADSSIYVKAPCKWSYDRIPRSILATGMKDIRLITNSVDTDTFFPADRNAVRRRLELPEDAFIVMYAAQSIEGSFYKDFPTLKAAMEMLAQESRSRKIIFLTVGGAGRKEGRMGSIETLALPFVHDREALADLYRASDVFVHAGIEEVWGLTMTEAMACGTPVVASAVGGIPEQVWHEQNGLLVPPQEPRQLADAIGRIVDDDALRERLSFAAARIARDNFSVKLAASKHLDYYESILQQHRQVKSGRQARNN